MKSLKLILLLLILLPLVGLAQTSSSKPGKKKKFLKEEKDQKIFEKAQIYFEEQSYALALKEYKKLETDFPDEGVLVYHIGVCYLYSTENKSRSLDYFRRLEKKKFKNTDLIMYLGMAYHLNYKFDSAIVMYNQFLGSKRASTPVIKKQVEHLIDNSNNGKELCAHPGNAKIVNIGAPVNTPNSEYVPAISSDESVMIFTYNGERSMGGLQSEPGVADERGQYFEDVFETHKDSAGNWTNPEPINNICTNGPDACIYISNDGQKLLVFKNSPGDVGDIYMSKLEGTKWTEPERLAGDVNTESWEGSASLTSDEKTLYFSSERPGGYGGRDIYKASLMPDGTWGKVVNLGPKINTEYNDDSPIIHPDGVSLYFNSEGHNSMGLNDVFVTVLVDDSVWLDPINLGYPINTPDDDRYFFPAADGKHGYYSTGKEGGLGEQDIYRIDGLGRKSGLVMVKGVVTLDDKPVEAQITVVAENTDKDIPSHHSNSATGKYLYNLPAGKKYTMKYRILGYDEQVKTLSTMTVDTFLESIIDIQFLSETYKARLKRMQDSLALKKDSLLARKDTTRLSSSMSMSDMLSHYGDQKVEGLQYKVQIGAYNLPDHFNYTGLLKLGTVKKEKDDDGITRFTIGKKMTLNEAHAFKNKVVEAGVTDAFVTAFYKGKRVLIKDLAAMHVFDNSK